MSQTQPGASLIRNEPRPFSAILGKALWGSIKKRSPKQVSCPAIELLIPKLKFSTDHLMSFKNLCEFELDPSSNISQQPLENQSPARLESIPLTYPHVCLSAYMAELVVHPLFPMPALGLVHQSHAIVQHQLLSLNNVYHARCFIEGGEISEKGVTYTLISHVMLENKIVWTSETKIFARTQTATSNKLGAQSKAGLAQNLNQSAEPADPLEATTDPENKLSQSWHVAENMGRKVAKLTEDYNPIHLYALSARLFGFKRPIVHGIWTESRALAALSTAHPKLTFNQLKVDFKRPILLPAHVEFSARQAKESSDTIEFEVVSGGKVRLTGSMGYKARC